MMTQWVKAPGTKAVDLSFIPGINIEGKIPDSCHLHVYTLTQSISIKGKKSLKGLSNSLKS